MYQITDNNKSYQIVDGSAGTYQITENSDVLGQIQLVVDFTSTQFSFKWSAPSTSTLIFNWGDGTTTEVDGQDAVVITTTSSYSDARIYNFHITGDVTDLTFINISSHTFVSGSVSRWSELTNLTYIRIDSTSVFGDISGWSVLTGLTLLYFSNSSVSGDISGFSTLTSLTKLYAYLSSVTFDSSPAWSNTGAIRLYSINNGGATATMVDNMLASLAGTPVTGATISIAGTNADRTEASEADKVAIEAAGNTLDVNEAGSITDKLGTANYIRSIKWTYNDVTSDFLIEAPTQVCSDTVAAGGVNANTGLAYDFIKNEFFVVNFEVDQRIIRYDRDFNVLGYIEPSGGGGQGMTIDVFNELVFIWTGSLIQVYNYSGVYQYEYPLSDDDGTAGSLEFDYRFNQVVTRPYIGSYTNYHVRNQVASEIYKVMELGRDEGIAITQWWYDYMMFAGTHSDDLIRQYDYYGNLIDTWVNPSANYAGDPGGGAPGAFEGMIFDPTDGTVWFNADQYTHGSVVGGNRIWHIDPLENYNKFLMFPAISFSLFSVTGVATANSDLLIQKATDPGAVLSPVIDFASYTINRVLDNLDIDSDLTYTVEFRGSDTVPSTTITDIFNLNMYDANNTGDGWGTTVPSAYQETIPDNRYIQFKINIS